MKPTSEVRITIWDRDGNVIVDEMQPCATATDREIDEMIELIVEGVPAHISAYLVTSWPIARVVRSPETLADLRAAFEADAPSYPTMLPAELYWRATAEGFDMKGYRLEC